MAAETRSGLPVGRVTEKSDWLRSPCIYLFLGTFLIRVFALVRLTDSQFLLPVGGDMQFYNEWALRILRGQWTEHTAFYGLPLYAYMLAAIYKICGYSPFVPGLLQAACEGGTAVLLYKLGSAAFAGAGEDDFGRQRGKVIGVMAAVGWGFFLPAQGYSIILMPTAWLVFIFWFVVWQIIRRQKAPGPWALLALGGLIGFTAMGIATILFLVPLLIAALFFRWRARPTEGAVGAALILAGVLLGAAPASLHNYVLARDPVFLSAHSGVNFWIGNNPVATGYPKFPPGLHAGQDAMLKDSITAAEKAAGHPLKRSEVSAFWSHKASDWIRGHPSDWIHLLGKKLRNFWSAFRYDDISVITSLRDQGVILPGEGFGLVAALGLAGFLFAWRCSSSSRWIAAAVFLHMASLMPVFVTERYRLAAVPGLLLLGSFGIWQLWQNLARARYLTAALFLGALFGTTAFVSMPQRDSTLWALDTYNSGLQALDAGQLALARRKLDLAYAYSPHNAEINFAEGNLHLALGETPVATRHYFMALQLDPRHAGANNNLGILALREGRWSLAIAFFHQVLKQTPDDAKIYFLIAQAQLRLPDRDTARQSIARAVELDPGRREFRALQQDLAVTRR